jgi:hypothetical protein
MAVSDSLDVQYHKRRISYKKSVYKLLYSMEKRSASVISLVSILYVGLFCVTIQYQMLISGIHTNSSFCAYYYNNIIHLAFYSAMLWIQIILMRIRIRPLKKLDADPTMLYIKFCNEIFLLKMAYKPYLFTEKLE